MHWTAVSCPMQLKYHACNPTCTKVDWCPLIHSIVFPIGVTAKAAVSGGGCGGACIGVIIGAILGAIFGAILVVVIVVVIVGVCIHVGMKSSAVAPSAVPSAGQNGYVPSVIKNNN